MIRIYLLILSINIVDGVGMSEFLKHNKASGTQNIRKLNVTHGKLPHLPAVHGFMGTQATYRFLSVFKQTAWLVGEPKHGLWRYQENGMIREYRRKGKIGLRDGIDPNDANLSPVYKDIIDHNYAAYIPEEGGKGYKYPHDRISKGDGTYDTRKGFLNFIDLSIYHPKYKGKYESHVPIDLPAYFCTLSQANFPHAYNAWRYLVKQKGADKMGPLALRAGLDIKEHYRHVARFQYIHDANIWANIGSEDGLDPDTGKPNPNFTQTINYAKISHKYMKFETYLVERIFFNEPYLFIIMMMDNKEGPSEHSYIRPDGPYWNGLKARNLHTRVTNHKPLHTLNVYVMDWPAIGDDTKKKYIARGMPIYGGQNPERVKNGLYGGACPARGGDWGTYPWGNGGAGYASTYEEITPLCDAMALDLKLTHNLWVETWNDPAVGLSNAGYDKLVMPYFVDTNVYGRYTDPYLLRTNAKNPSIVDFTKDGKIVQPNEESKKNRTSINLKYVHIGVLINYTEVEGLRPNTYTACPTKTPSSSVTVPKSAPNPEPVNKGSLTKKTTTLKPASNKPHVRTCPPIPTCPATTQSTFVSMELLIITSVSLAVIFIVLLLILILICINRTTQSRHVSGRTNEAASA